MIRNSAGDPGQWMHPRFHDSCFRKERWWLAMPKLQSMVTILVFASPATWPGQSHAASLITIVSFGGARGATPVAGLTADTNGNLSGTTSGGGAHDGGAVFEIIKTAEGYASTPTTLVSFCALANCADAVNPQAGLIADAKGNLIGTTPGGGAYEGGTVFEIIKTAGGYASTPTTLVSFCARANCADGAGLVAGLIPDADGNLFGTTLGGGANHHKGTVFEIARTASGFIPFPRFAGMPGKADCHGMSVSVLARQYGGLNAAAAALGYSSLPV
jgi:hypothetical protein